MVTPYASSNSPKIMLAIQDAASLNIPLLQFYLLKQGYLLPFADRSLPSYLTSAAGNCVIFPFLAATITSKTVQSEIVVLSVLL
jgi:hypothetical protein